MILFLIIFIAVSVSPALAQPQAPITWGPMRIIKDGGQTYYPLAAYSHGDTLVLLGSVGDTPHFFACACVSPDNGTTWSDWHAFTIDQSWSPTAQVVFTSQGIYCCAQSSDDRWALHRTTDLGQTWQPPTRSFVAMRAYAVRNDTIFCAVRYDSVVWTADGGVTYSPPRPTGLQGHVSDLSASSQHLHAVCHGLPSSNWQERCARGPLYGGEFEPYRVMHTTTAEGAVGVEMSDDGTGAIAADVGYTYVPPAYAILQNTTHDDGTTWSADDSLEPNETGCLAHNPGNPRHDGHHWMTIWGDTAQPGFSHAGYCYAFSANHLRSRYPTAQIEGDSIFSGCEGDIFLRANAVRLTQPVLGWNGEYHNYWVQWEGSIHPDTVPPEVYDGQRLDTLYAGGEQVELMAAGEDQDSLWLVEMVVRRAGSADSLVIPLAEDPEMETVYRGVWPVPVDSADHLYYYRFEDMWENVSFHPEAGPAEPWRTHVGPYSAARDFILHPSSFILSVFPNPVNSVAVIELQLPSFGAEARLELFDVLGRRIYENTIHNASGTTRLFLDTSSWPSGLYFVKASCGARQAHQKLLVLK
jgi:hypothetical protein